MPQPQATLLAIGLGGSSAHFPPFTEGTLSYGPGSSSSHGTDPDAAAISADTYHDFDPSTCTNTKRPGRLAIGAFIVDKRAPLADRPNLAIISPLPTGGETSRLDIPKGSMVAKGVARHSPLVASALQAHRTSASTLRSLDYASPQDYADWWREHGARIGRWNGTSIDWE